MKTLNVTIHSNFANRIKAKDHPIYSFFTNPSSILSYLFINLQVGFSTQMHYISSKIFANNRFREFPIFRFIICLFMKIFGSFYEKMIRVVFKNFFWKLLIILSIEEVNLKPLLVIFGILNHVKTIMNKNSFIKQVIPCQRTD